MKFEMAPMEGVTTYIYRRAYARYFGEIDRYYTPFLSLYREKEFNHKEKNEILPEHNEGMEVIPQVLTNSSADFLRAAHKLAALGYREININLGCPSGTVTAKGKGAGMLEDVRRLDAFLYEVFASSPVAVSIKTRLGMENVQEWHGLLEVYRKYRMRELIVHARVREDYYKNKPDWQSFAVALADNRWPVCYNGDIFGEEDYRKLTETFPALDRVMLGRGLVADPALPERLRQLSGQCADGKQRPENPAAAVERFRAFHDEVYQGYQGTQMGERNVLYRMKELWTYMIGLVEPADRYLKMIRKANRYDRYEEATGRVFMQLRERCDRDM